MNSSEEHDLVECLVSYAYGEYQVGFDNIKVQFENYPPTIIDILDLQEAISEKKSRQSVKVLNVVKLSPASEESIIGWKEKYK